MKSKVAVVKEELVREIREDLAKKADKNCKICFGRGYTGVVRDTFVHIPCRKCYENKWKKLIKDMRESKEKGDDAS